MKTLLVFVTIVIACNCNLFAQTFTFEKQTDLSVSVWNRDTKMGRVLWLRNNVKTDLAISCFGHNLTRFIIKQKGAADVTEIIDHPELGDGGYLVLKFKNEVKHVNAYYPRKELMGYTVEITLK